MRLPGLEIEWKLAGEAGERIDDFAGKRRGRRENDGEEEYEEKVQRRRRRRLRGSCHSLLLETSPPPLLTAHQWAPCSDPVKRLRLYRAKFGGPRGVT